MSAVDAVPAKPFVSFLPDPVTERSQKLERLETELTELWAHISAADYRFLQLVAEFDKLKGYEAHGLTGTAQWLGWQCGICGNAARERVRVARALEHLPKISDAFRRGVIGYSKVRAITRVATPADEHILLNTALHGASPHAERHVRGFRFCQRRDEARAANESHCERYLKVYRDENGAVVIHAVLPAEVGALVEKALEAAVAELEEPAAAEVTETESNVSAETRVSTEPRAGEADTTPSLRAIETESNVSTETPAANEPDGSAEAGAVAVTETAVASTPATRISRAASTRCGGVLEPSADGTLEELLRECNRRAGLEIDAQTDRCGWRGERFDVSAAIEAQQWHRERGRCGESEPARG